jgi:hypothetical protein
MDILTSRMRFFESLLLKSGCEALNANLLAFNLMELEDACHRTALAIDKLGNSGATIVTREQLISVDSNLTHFQEHARVARKEIDVMINRLEKMNEKQRPKEKKARDANLHRRI